MLAPNKIEIVGDFVAIQWADQTEHFLSGEFLRERSPSAENMGEVDILGKRWGGDGPRQFPGVSVMQLTRSGNYAVTFEFSDGHKNGTYGWEYPRQNANVQKKFFS